MSKYQNKSFRFENALTSEQANFFNAHGILHLKGFVSRDTVNKFTSELDKIQFELISKNVKKINGVPLKYGYASNQKKIIQRLAFASHYSELLSNFLKDKRLGFLGVDFSQNIWYNI